MADSNDGLPPLQKKSWSDFRLTSAEWKLVKMVYDCLEVGFLLSSLYFSHLMQIVAARHNELSNEELATCTRVLPMLELLMSEWEDLLTKPEYEPVHGALRAGVALLEKYYRRADDTDAYFIAHGEFAVLYFWFVCIHIDHWQFSIQPSS